MKASFTFIALMTCCLFSFAQKSKTVYIDTINLRGIIIDSYDKPVPNISLLVTQKDLTYQLNYLSATTDANGLFEVKGAKPNDTITITDPIYRSRYPNNGSRFVVIRLPHKTGALTPIEIKAQRQYPKLTPKFTIIPYVPPNDFVCILSYEQFADFPGGVTGFERYIQKHLIYPKNAIRNNIEGRVEASFDITRDGSVDNVKIIKGIGYGCDEIILNILTHSPKWSPYKASGRAGIQNMTVSIEFKLTDI